MENKTTRKIVYGAIATVLLSSTLVMPATAFASTSTSEQIVQEAQQEETFSNSNLTEEDSLAAEKYISFDSALKQFKVSPLINVEMAPEKVNIINAQVAETNEHLRSAKNESGTNVTAIAPDGTESTVKRALLKGAGVNSITFHWNYARVKLSKNTVQSIGAGLTLGGIWIPHKVVSKVCASLGVGVSRVKHGIWFGYNYFSNLVLSGYGWQ